MRELCASHNLVLGADGKCVLCRRPKQPLFAVREETESLVSKVFTWFLFLCLLAAGGALINASRLGAGYTGGRYTAAPDQRRADASSPQSATKLAQNARPRARGDQPRQAPTRAAQKPSAITSAAAVAAAPPVPVTMYSAPWCYICDRSRDFLLARNVTLTELDIERDHAAAKRLRQLNPTSSLPTFEVAGRVYIGFNPWDLEDAIRDAMLQRYSARTP
jgi:glutaredoxin